MNVRLWSNNAPRLRLALRTRKSLAGQLYGLRDIARCAW